VTTMMGMFDSCKSLKSLDLSSFNTSKVENMEGMFYLCENLTSLDISSFDTSQTTAMTGFFEIWFCRISELKLGPAFQLKTGGEMARSTDGAGHWLRSSTSQTFSPSELGAKYSSSGSPELATYYWLSTKPSVKFDANGAATGTAPDDVSSTGVNTTVQLPAGGQLTWNRHSVTSWNTKPDGTGDSYAADGTGTISVTNHDVLLYAQWEKTATTTTLSKNWSVQYAGAPIAFRGGVQVESAGTQIENPRVTYLYCTSKDGVYSANLPSQAGTYWVKAEFVGNSIYAGSESAPVSFEILSDYVDFSDVKNDVKANGFGNVWYVSNGWLDYVVENGLMSGYNSGEKAGSFGPYDSITRGQVAVILYRYACRQDSSLETTYGSTYNTNGKSYATNTVFSDEAPDVYYTAAINWARAAGIMTGYTSVGGSYYRNVMPDAPITREELCVMLERFAQKLHDVYIKYGSVDYSGIQGMESVDSWAEDSVGWCASYGIIGGVNVNGTYWMNPTDSTWRASMAKMITVTVRDVM